MDRRTVLKSLTCLCAWPALSSATTFETSSFSGTRGLFASRVASSSAGRRVFSGSRIGIIAIGGAGGQTLPAVHQSVVGGARSIAIDLDPVGLQRVNADCKILVEQRRGFMLCESSRLQIDDALAGLDLAIIVAGIGGAAGSMLSPSIAQATQVSGIPTYAVALVPAEFSCGSGGGAAKTALAQLRDNTIATFQVPIGKADIGPFNFWRIRSLEDQPERPVQQLLHSLAMPLSEQTALGLSIEDFKEVLYGKGDAAFGIGYARGKDAAALATRRAIDHPLLGKPRLLNAQGILVLVQTSRAYITFGRAAKICAAIRDATPLFFDGPVYFDFMARPESALEEFRVTILAGGLEPEAV